MEEPMETDEICQGPAEKVNVEAMDVDEPQSVQCFSVVTTGTVTQSVNQNFNIVGVENKVEATVIYEVRAQNETIREFITNSNLQVHLQQNDPVEGDG